MQKLQLNSSEPKRIVLCRLGGIGDVIHTLPLVKHLKKIYKNTSVEYITSTDIAELLSNSCPYIDKIWIFDKKNKSSLVKEILKSKERINYFFNLHSSLSFFLFNLFHLHARKFFQYKKDPSIHAVINFAKTFDSNLSGLHLESKTIFIDPDWEKLALHELVPDKYICLVPGVGNVRPHRAWAVENWLSLAKKILYYEKDLKVVYLGGESEIGLIENSFNFENRIINLIGKLSLFETAQVISGAVYLISCDTGLLHVASALSKKVIGLYGPTMSSRSGPYTGNYQVFVAKDCKCNGGVIDVKKCKKTKELSGYCMNSLTVNEVVSGVPCNAMAN